MSAVICGITAEARADSQFIQAVVNQSNRKVSSKLSGNVYSHEMDFP